MSKQLPQRKEATFISIGSIAMVFFYVILHDQAVVGLAGTTDNINIEADGLSRFEGKCLNSGNTYVRTRHGSHANVSPVQKLIAMLWITAVSTSFIT